MGSTFQAHVMCSEAFYEKLAEKPPRARKIHRAPALERCRESAVGGCEGDGVGSRAASSISTPLLVTRKGLSFFAVSSRTFSLMTDSTISKRFNLPESGFSASLTQRRVVQTPAFGEGGS